MEFIVTKKRVSDPPKSVFKFTLDFMVGDADGYSEGELFASEVTDEMKELIKMMKKIRTPYERSGFGGQGCRDAFDAGVQFVLNNSILRPIAVENEEYAEDHATEYLYDLGWESDPHAGIPNSPQGWNMTYFDNEGIEYKVKVNK